MGGQQTRRQRPSRHERKRKKAPPVMCIYCQEREAQDEEHVFAKALFDSPQPPPILVPACHPCNSGKGDGNSRDMHLDEEYFRNMVCAKSGARLHPTAAALLEGKITRSFKNSPKMAVSFLNSLRPVRQVTPDGRVLPPLSIGVLDRQRMERVLRKITKGLFYHYFKKCLATTTDFQFIPLLQKQLFSQTIAEVLSHPNIGTHSMQNDAVLYTGALAVQTAGLTADPNGSVWVYLFYRSFGVMVVTCSKGQLQ